MNPLWRFAILAAYGQRERTLLRLSVRGKVLGDDHLFGEHLPIEDRNHLFLSKIERVTDLDVLPDPS